MTGSAEDHATIRADDLASELARLPIEAVRDAARVRAALQPADTLGPAALAYLDRPDFTPAPGPVERLAADHGDVLRLVASVSAEDAGECGLDEITSAAFVVRTGTDLVAAAGYCRWPGRIAHLCVLTGTAHRAGAWPPGPPPPLPRTPSGTGCCRSGGPARPRHAGWRDGWASGSSAPS